jgi:hypothetical protein
MNFKKYTLKPGRHQFAPGSHAIHNNDNLSDEEAAWYLERYPHIAAMFIINPKDEKSNIPGLISAESDACRVSEVEISNESPSVKSTSEISEIKLKSVESQEIKQ